MRWFTCFPYAVLALAFFAFVLTGRMRWGARAAWTAALLVCCAKYVVFRHFGGNAYHPELSEPLIWIWNWAYYGAAILALAAVPLCRWRAKARNWLLPLGAWTLSAVGVWNGVKPPQVTERELTYSNLPAELDGYRIAQVADIHCSSMMRRWRTQAVVDLVNAQRADLICLLGDSEDGDPALRFPDLQPLRDLRAKDGVWAVTGNHEYFYEPERWLPEYGRRLGVRFLENECVHPRKSLALGGVNDDEIRLPQRKLGRKVLPDIGAAFAAATNGEFRVLLRHRPGDAAATLARHGIDLQLSGHTHGGFMPVVSWLVAGVNHGFIRGVHDFGGRKLCLSNGVGQTAAIPLRFFTPAEVVVVTLRRGR